MSRLSATDAMFAYANTTEVPMNMGSVSILKPPAERQGDFFIEFKDFVRERLPYLPKLKKRLVVDTIGLPTWVDVDDVDLDYHVRRTRLRSGDERELARKIGRLQHQQFDFDKPLFMFHVIEGLSGGRIALVQKYHHTVADGKTAVQMMDLFSDEGLERTTLTRGDTSRHGAPNSLVRKLAGYADDARRTWRSLPGLVGAGRSMLGSDGKRMMERINSRPVTVFNQPLSEKRLFVFQHWPLSRINRLRRAAGLTFNDIGLVLFGGALRRYLDELDALPAQSLLCNVPVSVETGNSGGNGNEILTMWVPMGTHLADPRQRIAFVKQEATECKQFLKQLVDAAQAGRGMQLPSFLVRLVALPMGSVRLTEKNPLPGNVSMSNVPAPADYIHINGVRVDTLYGMSMLLPAQAVSATFASYAGQVVASILCCEEALPDPERLFGYMTDEMRELEQLYTKPRKRSPAKKRPARK